MTEKPILFSGPMVRAILEGRKTQTRRVVKGMALDWLQDFNAGFVADPGNTMSPYGHPGDRLWVRETWKPDETPDEGHDEIGDAVGDDPPGIAGIRYRADDALIQIENTEDAASRWHDLLRPEETWPELKPTKWRPSIHMHRWTCRLLLDVKAIRVERLQDINGIDALAEGITREDGVAPWRLFKRLWDSLNKKRGYGWKENPWVWVVEFKQTPVQTGQNP